MSYSSNKPIAIWLLVCCALVFAMVVLGGVTRLTQSGLSMVEWDPIMGVVPPLSDSEWQTTFKKYQQFPEYQLLNKGMELGEFKKIFYVEYAHRILGRAIGLVFFIPFLVFLVMRRIERPLIPKLITMFILGGLQGLLGWYMVKSGLINEPHVSPYRLTAHLGLAVLIFGYMLWVAFDLLQQDKPSSATQSLAMRRLGVFVVSAIAIMLLSGGFVAGTKAGFAFNTFPLMHGRWVPEGAWAMQPGWRNLFENIATVQFIHRCIALVLAILIPVYWLAMVRSTAITNLHTRGHALLAMLLIQLTLGITTLIYVVPVPLAAAHQGGALLLLALALYALHGLYRGPQKVRING